VAVYLSNRSELVGLSSAISSLPKVIERCRCALKGKSWLMFVPLFQPGIRNVRAPERAIGNRVECADILVRQLEVS
jgi:hypothetical protein